MRGTELFGSTNIWTVRFFQNTLYKPIKDQFMDHGQQLTQTKVEIPKTIQFDLI